MDRRTFSKTVAGAALGAGTLTRASERTEAAPFQFSIMLWTVFRDLAFEQRLERCVEAGYHNVELVGEYKKWGENDFKRAIAKRKELAINFDVTAGLKHGVGNPADREAMLADVRNELPIMERIDCPAVIVMSGNVVPGMPRETQHQSCIEGLKHAARLIEGKQIN